MIRVTTTENAYTKVILKTLKDSLDIPDVVKINHDPFETLIKAIISQNTADTNTEKAFKNLSNQYKISPTILANAKENDIEECLHVCGLYKSKAQTIKIVSKIINEKYEGSLNQILSLPFEAARKILMGMPGVGPKTADVVLLFSEKKPTIPIDTHVNRVSKRLGMVPYNGSYETVRQSLQSICNPKDYMTVHLLLIALGRKYCKARIAICIECPVNAYCPSKIIRGKP